MVLDAKLSAEESQISKAETFGNSPQTCLELPHEIPPDNVCLQDTPIKTNSIGAP